MRSLKAETSRTRFDYIRSRAEAVNEEQTAKREGLASKLQVRHCQAEQRPKAHRASLTQTMSRVFRGIGKCRSLQDAGASRLIG